MIEIIFLAILVLISLALGQRIFRLAGVKFDLYPENFIFSFPFGLAILAYIAFFFGMVGLLYKPIIIAVIASLFVLLIKDITGILSILLNSIKDFKIKRAAKKYELGLNFHTVVILFIFLFSILNFLISFSPPWHFDVLTYHLAVQKLYINAHGIISLPYLFYSNIPHLADTISLVGLILHNAILSHLLAYSLGITAVLAIFSFCKRFFSYKAGLLASLIFLSAPMITEGFSIAHIDVQFTLFVFLALYGLFAYISFNKMQWLILCSIFAGMSIATKIFGVLAATGIFILLVFHLVLRLSKKKISYKALIYRIMVFFLIVFLITFPWMLKAYIHTGNPVWPTLNEAFHGKYWDEKHTEDLAKRELVRELNVANYLRLPWDIHTQTGKNTGNILEHEGMGPFFLAFLPIYFVLRRKNTFINLMFILMLIYISMWFFISQEFRHLIFILPLIAVISAYVAEELFKNKLMSSVLKALLIFTFSFNLIVWAGGNAKEIPVALGMETADSYYSKNPGAIYTASKFINYNLPKDSKILLFRDTRGYFLDREYVWGDPLLQVFIDYSKYSNEEDFYDDLKLLGVTHILVNNEFDYEGFIVNEYRYNERILNMMDRLLKKHAREIYNAGGITISELRQK